VRPAEHHKLFAISSCSRFGPVRDLVDNPSGAWFDERRRCDWQTPPPRRDGRRLDSGDRGFASASGIDGFTVCYEADGTAVGVLTCNADDDVLGGRLFEAGKPAPVPMSRVSARCSFFSGLVESVANGGAAPSSARIAVGRPALCSPQRWRLRRAAITI
jgi:hypothetical protein